jgi:hypothetical protein
MTDLRPSPPRIFEGYEGDEATATVVCPCCRMEFEATIPMRGISLRLAAPCPTPGCHNVLHFALTKVDML